MGDRSRVYYLHIKRATQSNSAWRFLSGLGQRVPVTVTTTQHRHQREGGHAPPGTSLEKNPPSPLPGGCMGRPIRPTCPSYALLGQSYSDGRDCTVSVAKPGRFVRPPTSRHKPDVKRPQAATHVNCQPDNNAPPSTATEAAAAATLRSAISKVDLYV